jgi:hypothetical protein
MSAQADPPLGEMLDWQPVQRPTSTSLRGSHVMVRPVNAEDDAVPRYST